MECGTAPLKACERYAWQWHAASFINITYHPQTNLRCNGAVNFEDLFGSPENDNFFAAYYSDHN